MHPWHPNLCSRHCLVLLAGTCFLTKPALEILLNSCAKPVDQQFPVLNTPHMSPPFVASSMSQHGDNSGKQCKVWRMTTTCCRAFKFPSPLPSSMHPSNNMTTSWAQCVQNDHNFVKVGHNSLEFGACSSSRVLGYGAQSHGGEMSQQQVPSEIVDASLSGGVFQRQVCASDAPAVASVSSWSHSQQQDLERARHGDDAASFTGKRNLDAFFHAHDNQMKAMNSPVNSVSEVQHTCALGGPLLNGGASGFRQAVDSGPDSASQPNQFPSHDSNILNFSGEARDISIVKAFSQPRVLVRPPRDIVTYGDSISQNLSSRGNVPSNHTNYDLVNARVFPSWLKQSASPRNGQMVPISDTRPAKTAATQVALGKPSQALHGHTSLEQLDTADGVQIGMVWSSTMISMAGHQQLSVPYGLPSESLNQMATKRKINSIELLLWHKEVMQDFKQLRNIRRTSRILKGSRYTADRQNC